MTKELNVLTNIEKGNICSNGVGGWERTIVLIMITVF